MASAPDIVTWLAGHGLERYATAFQGNDIGLDVLDSLSEGDLKELGVSLGDRKRLLAAIATLGSLSAVARTPIPSDAPIRGEAERRQLTVLFCDLVGSTELSQRLDPEDLRDVMRVYQDTCAGVVARYEVIVAKFLGDGVLAYFGFPLAHEDDAERAVRAGLEMAAAVARLGAADASLGARVGIATGLVVVGDMGGSGDANAVAGETPNLAARLQAEAPPGGVVIAPATRRLIGEWFAYRDIGNRSLKGINEPVTLTQVLGERVSESRFAAIRAARLSPFVGREQELGLLLDRWRMAQEGEGQIVLLSGEAGIGKSRVAETLRERVGTDDAIRIRYQCSPYHATSALYPAIEQLRAAAGIAPEDIAATKLEKLERAADRDVVPLLAALLGIPTEPHYPPLNQPPDVQRARTLAALAGQLYALAGRGPVLFLVEDAHWIDPTTRELVDQIIEPIGKRRVLLLVTARPEFQNLWSIHPHVTTLSLNRLGQRQSAELVARMIGAGGLPDSVAQAIVARADGVPLFVEELTKSVLEIGTEHAVAIPATLQDSLLARLDRLAASKEVAQIGAIIGRTFSYRLLAAVAGLAEPLLHRALAELEAAGLVFRRGTPPDAAYTFKHALVQDAAHSTLLNRRRQELHARIAVVIESDHPELAAEQPELVAQHYSKAGMPDQAVPRWLTAADRLVRRYAVAEAIDALLAALSDLARLNAGETCDRLYLDVAMRLAQARYLQGRFEDAIGSLVREEGRLVRLANPAVTGPFRFWLGHMYVRVGRHDDAECQAMGSLEAAEQIGDDLTLGKALGVKTLNAAYAGRLDDCAEFGRRAIAALERTADRYWLGVTHTYAAAGCMYSGDISAALKHAEASVEIGEKISDPRVSTYGLMVRGAVHAYAGRHDAALDAIKTALQLAPDPASRAYISATLGYVYLEAGDAAQAVDLLENGVKTFEAFHLPAYVSLYGGYLADARRLLGDFAGARNAAEHAIRVSTSCGYPYSLGWTVRVLGRLAMAEGETDVARGHLEKARDIFSAMGAALELDRTVRELVALTEVGRSGTS